MATFRPGRRAFLQGAGALVTSLLVSRRLHAQSLPPARPPNVLFILADDLGWGDLGCYGHPYVQTPNLDRLAQQGSRFSQFYTAAPVCSPTRAGCLTGHFPARYRIYGVLGTHAQNQQRRQVDWLDPAAPTVCRAFQQAGYVTGHIGKWHLGGGSVGAPPPTDYGLDYTHTSSSSTRDPAWDLDSDEFVRHSSAWMVDDAIPFIQSHAGQPWYLNLWLASVHAPIGPAPEDLARYAELVPNPDDFSGYMPAYLRRAKDLTAQMRSYCAAVTAMDSAIGRLLDFLEQRGLADNTIVIFASDNGPDKYKRPQARFPGVGSPGRSRGRKGKLFEGGVRTPLIVRWPGQVPAGRVDESSVVAAVDLMPTLCGLANVPLPEGYVPDGENVGDIWRGAARTRQTPLFWRVVSNPRLAMRTGDYKLIMNSDGSNRKLYNLAADPEERRNLVSGQTALANSLRTQLQAWVSSLPAPLSASVPDVPEEDEMPDWSEEEQVPAAYLPLMQR